MTAAVRATSASLLPAPEQLTEDHLLVLLEDLCVGDPELTRVVLDAAPGRRCEVGDDDWRAARSRCAQLWAAYAREATDAGATTRLAHAIVDRLAAEVDRLYGQRRDPGDPRLNVWVALDVGRRAYRIVASARQLAESERVHGLFVDDRTHPAQLREELHRTVASLARAS